MGELRKRGRPKGDEEGSAVTIWVPKSMGDRITELAKERGVTKSTLLREILLARRNQQQKGKPEWQR